MTSGALVLTLIGFATLTLRGWLGGTVVFVDRMCVLYAADDPALRAATPGHEQNARASGVRADHEAAPADLTRR